MLLPLFIGRDLGSSQLLIGIKLFSQHICCENIAKCSRVNRQMTRQTDHGQTELNNMLVKRSVLNEIKKVGTYSGFQGLKEDQRDSILKLGTFKIF